MFGSIGPSSYDLDFRVAGIPVRVTPWFWVGSIILGWSSVRLGIDFLAAWVLVVFVSILVHELGHALVARMFGFPPHIILYQFGGLAVYQPHGRISHARSILISLSGPLAGFALYALLLLLGETVFARARLNLDARTSRLAYFAVGELLWVNLWWGVINLLPVLPLDGGQICREMCLWVNRARGMVIATSISMVVAFGAAALLYQSGYTYATILFVFLGIESLVSLQDRGGAW